MIIYSTFLHYHHIAISRIIQIISNELHYNAVDILQDIHSDI